MRRLPSAPGILAACRRPIRNVLPYQVLVRADQDPPRWVYLRGLVGDHAPRHVHVFRDGRLILKWNLEKDLPIEGRASPRLLEVIRDLRREGRL